MTYQENLAHGRGDAAEGVIQKPIADDKTFEPPVDDSEPGPTRPDPTDGDGAADHGPYGGRGNDILIGGDGTDFIEAPGHFDNDLLIVNNGDGSDFLESETLDINLLTGNDAVISEAIPGGDGEERSAGSLNTAGLEVVIGSTTTDTGLPSSDGEAGGGVRFGGSGGDVLLGDRGGDRSTSADDLLDQPEPPSDPNEPTRPDPGDADGAPVEDAFTFNFTKIGVVEHTDSAAAPDDGPTDLLIVNNGDGSVFVQGSYNVGGDLLAGGEGADIYPAEGASEPGGDTAFIGNRGNDIILGQDGTDLDGIDAASGFTPLIAFAPEAEPALDPGDAAPMMSFDDIM